MFGTKPSEGPWYAEDAVLVASLAHVEETLLQWQNLLRPWTCGLPIGRVDATDPLADSPCGSDTYKTGFLSQTEEALQRRLRVLVTFVLHHEPHMDAMRMALQILRVNVSARCVHLYRLCPQRRTLDWTAHIAADVYDWIHFIAGLPIAGPHPQVILHMPTMYVTLGIPHGGGFFNGSLKTAGVL